MSDLYKTLPIVKILIWIGYFNNDLDFYYYNFIVIIDSSENSF